MADVQTLPDPEDTPETLLARYKEEIKYYEKESQAWDERARKILRRYKDERSPREMRVARFNILYSNIQTLLPAIYGRNPKSDIERRFRDKDDLGRVTSDILERCTDFYTNTEAFRSSLRSALFDRLTAGRGSVWARYVPHFRPIENASNEEQAELGVEISQDVDELQEAEESDEPNEEVYHEDVDTDYVHWADLGHNWARTWDEVYLVWRKVYLSRKELKDRFGEDIAKMIPLDYFPKGLNDQKKETSLKRAVIYECWDESEKMVRWVHKDVVQFLDEKEDPLNLPDFFPCPKPLYSVLANDTMIPVPDYSEYQDQANELDEITSRIAAITKALKVAGVYDASAPGVERLLAEGVENKLIPVEQWAIFGEKGGLKGVVDFLPLETIASALLTLYDCRDRVKNDLYEITGIADIIRGQSDPTETATAVNQKGKFATLRLSDAQEEMARFARDAVRNIACIIAYHFSLDTIKRISGIKLLTMQEKMQLQQQIQMQAQQQAIMAQRQQAPGQPPHPPQSSAIDSDTQELLNNPTWEEVQALLRDSPELSFKIDIETDSTKRTDEDEEKAARVEFLKASGEFLSAMQTAPAIAQPLLAHMLMFGVRGFRVGKEIEAQFEIFAQKLEKQAESAPLNPQNPEVLKAQADMQQKQAELAMKQKEMEMQAQVQAANDQRDAQREDQRAQREHMYKMNEIQQSSAMKEKELQMNFDFKMREMNAKLMTEQQEKNAQRQHEIDLAESATPEGRAEKSRQIIQPIIEPLTQQLAHHEQAIKSVAQNLDNLHQQIRKPKKVSMKARDGRTLTAIVQ